MKPTPYLFALLLLCGPLSGQNTLLEANGPNAPQVGDIVPDSVTFAMSTSSQAELINARSAQGSSFNLPNLVTQSYSDFPNEILATVYHTPW